MKTLLRVALAVVLAALLIVPVAAASPAVGPHIPAGRGFVTAKADTSFTVFYTKFRSATFQVNDQTEYFKEDGSAGTFADLQPGMKVAVRATQVGEVLVAPRVRFLHFETRPRIVVRREVIAKGDTSFDVHTPAGDFHFNVDGETIYHKPGGAATFTDVMVGNKVLVQAAMQADGSWLVTRVGILPGRGG